MYIYNNEGTQQDFVEEYSSQMLGGGSIFDQIGRGIESLWKTIINFFTSLLDVLNPTSDKFFLKQLGDAIATGFQAVCDAISSIVSAIGNAIQSVLEFLFIPEHNPFDELSEKINSKFGFIGQIQQLINNLLGFNNYGNSTPDFSITYYNTSVSIIDFSLFIQYRDWIHGIILAIAWTIFALKTYRKLPNVIGGYSE